MSNIQELAKELDGLIKIEPLLKDLYFHFMSQAKPHTTPITKEYSAKIAKDINEALKYISEGWR